MAPVDIFGHLPPEEQAALQEELARPYGPAEELAEKLAALVEGGAGERKLRRAILAAAKKLESEPRRRGRPTLTGEPLIKHSIGLPPSLLARLPQDRPLAEVVREALMAAYPPPPEE